MANKLDITKGEIISKEILNEKGSYVKIISKHESILGESICNITTRNEGRRDANAKIICDAFNTYQTCELLPSELLQQRNDLIDVFNRVLEREFNPCAVQDLKKLIQKITH